MTVFLIRVTCSGCPEDTEVVVETIEEVDDLFCECDCGWIVLSIATAVPV